ncbi:valine--pyruvate transaminase [Catenovulum sp. SM1970]|uniref:valine--pyruvate transaminase n=1 Tax=Marinifaba aquimaris TaxID=2741323 RepID=UPI001573FF71|nr:valine--pyruvate transaminase [Marinifaba aquimaris]NTS75540.1 valine--pyruvate transaminase [Marinifaba aquimaris]
MKLSQFGQQLTAESGIVNLMADLGDALNVNPDLLFLGGGNPAKIDEFEAIIAEHLHQIANNPDELHKLIGVYQSPQGSERFISALADYLNQTQGWNISEKNIAIANGSQSAFFILINMLAGQSERDHKKLLFPLMPEYLGYSDQGISDDYFLGNKPLIEKVGEHSFKYHIDFDALDITEQVAALCVSRPTNPTGNMVSDKELAQLSKLAKTNQIPLVIDCAYGEPFPGIVYQTTDYQWQPHHILALSLSKLGLPAVRTGIVIANEHVIEEFVKVNTIVSLANGNLGPDLMTRILQQGQLEHIKHTIIRPFYQAKRDHFIGELNKTLNGLPYRIHQAEGAFFLWIWFEGLPVSSTELYQLLKKQGVLVMDGAPFFFALNQNWQHTQECIRLSYCQTDDVLTQAAELIGLQVRALYQTE